MKALWHKAAKLGLKSSEYLSVAKEAILQLKLFAHLSKPLRLIYWQTIVSSFKTQSKVVEFLAYFYNTWFKEGPLFEDAHHSNEIYF